MRLSFLRVPKNSLRSMFNPNKAHIHSTCQVCSRLERCLFTTNINHHIPLDQETLGIHVQSVSKVGYLLSSMHGPEGVVFVKTEAVENRRIQWFWSKSTCVDQGWIMRLACPGHGWTAFTGRAIAFKTDGAQHNRTEGAFKWGINFHTLLQM